MLVVRTASDIDIVKHQHLQNRTSKRRKRKERVLSMFTSLSISDAIRSAYTKTKRRKKKNVLPYVNAEVSDARGAVKKHNGTLFRTQGFRLVTLGAGNNAKATAWG